MTYVVRIDPVDPRDIGPGELLHFVCKIWEDQDYTTPKVKVMWEEDPEPVEDPFLGQRQAMVAYGHKWLTETAGSPGDEIPGFPFIARAIREEWINNREFDGIDGRPYLDLGKFAEVARQVRRGWVQ